MRSERTPDLDLPALRAVIAKALSEYDEAVEDFWHSGGDRDPAVAKAKADGCRIALVRHIATLASACERLAEENERLREQLTAAEAAREAVAGEVREMCAHFLSGWQLPRPEFVVCGESRNEMLEDAIKGLRALPLSTPSAALQRVREEEYDRGHKDGMTSAIDLAQREAERRGAERANYWLRENGYTQAADALRLAALFSAPDRMGEGEG